MSHIFDVLRRIIALSDSLILMLLICIEMLIQKPQFSYEFDRILFEAKQKGERPESLDPRSSRSEP